MHVTYCTGVPDLTFGLSIVQDQGAFYGEQTAAHEIGHLLGSSHDGLNNFCSSEDGYMMMNHFSGSRSKKLNTYEWSKCSSETIISFLRTDQGVRCLYNQPDASPHRLMK